MSEANIKRKNCLHLFANLVIAGYATKIKSCHWCSIYYWKKFFLSSLLGVKDPFILFEKIIKFKSYRMQNFIVYPWSSLLLQNTGVGIIADIWYWPLQCCSAVQGCRGHCTSPDAAQPLGQDGAASRGDSHEMHHGEMYLLQCGMLLHI